MRDARGSFHKNQKTLSMHWLTDKLARKCLSNRNTYIDISKGDNRYYSNVETVMVKSMMLLSNGSVCVTLYVVLLLVHVDGERIQVPDGYTCAISPVPPWGLLEDCSGRNLKTVPDELLKTNVTFLDLKDNIIEYLEAQNFAGFISLIGVDLSGNGMSQMQFHSLEIRENAFVYLTGLRFMNLSANNINYVPSGTFSNMAQLIALDLSLNPDFEVMNWTFDGLSSLVHLNLSSNTRTLMHERALSGLSSLQYLDVHSDSLTDDSIATLSKLDSLAYLNLDMNDATLQRADMFSSFPNLSSLEINDNDINELSWEVFSVLPRLTKLYLKNNQIAKITSGRVTHIRSLLYLDLSNNALMHMTNGTFAVLTSLHYLDISGNYNFLIDSQTGVFSGMSILQQLHLEYVGINQLSTGNFLGLDSLRELHLNHNDISYIQHGAFSGLLALEYLNISYNSIRVMDSTSFEGLASLTYLDINANAISNISGSFTTLPKLTHLNMASNDIRVMDPESFVGLSSLRYLNIRHSKVAMIQARGFTDLQHLVELDLSYNELASIKFETFYGVPSLNKLNLSHNILRNISGQTFHRLSRLSSLDLSDNLLQNIHKGTFNDLSVLKYLNLSRNRLQTIRTNMVTGLNTLAGLFLSKNYVRDVSGILRSLQHLEELDLRSNRIYTVPKDDVILLRSSALKRFSASSNPFSCSCDLLYFVKWLQSVRNTIIADVPGDYKCSNSQTGIAEQVLLDCPSSSALYTFIGAAVSMTIVLIIIGSLGYYCRWKIRWTWYRLRYHHYQTLEHMADYDSSVKYDAFVAYNNQDIEFVQQQLIPHIENVGEEESLKVAVDFREFIPGHPLADEIITYIEKSRKTLLLLNSNFIDSNWTMFEYEMSRSKLASRRDAIVVVLLEDISNRMSELPKSLNALLKEKLYIEWTEDPEGQVFFWKKLRLALKKSSIIRRTEM